MTAPGEVRRLAVSQPAHERAGRGRVSLVFCSDELIRSPDVLDSAVVLARAGFGVDLLGARGGGFEPPSFAGLDIVVVAPPKLRERLKPLARRGRGLLTALAGRRRRSLRGSPRGDAVAAAPEALPDETPATPLVAAIDGMLTRVLRVLEALDFVRYVVLRLSRRPPRFAVAFDPVALAAVRIVAGRRAVPFGYHPRELLLSWDHRSLGPALLKRLERRAHAGAVLTVAHDRARAELLARDNGLEAASFLLVPNAPLGTDLPREATLRARLDPSPPPDARLVLYSGGITRAMLVRELVESTDRWPGDAVLVLHGPRNSPYTPEVEAARRPRPGRTFWLSTTVPFDEIDGIFLGADVGLALYRPIDDNFRYVGHAAGKIFRYLKMGVPVIANDIPGMRGLLEDTGCGRVVSDPAEIGPALEDLLARAPESKERCRALFERFEFSRHYGRVVDRIREATARARDA